MPAKLPTPGCWAWPSARSGPSANTPLADVSPRQERRNLRIEAGSDEAAGPVLKVSYQFANKTDNPINVEYRLAPPVRLFADLLLDVQQAQRG